MKADTVVVVSQIAEPSTDRVCRHLSDMGLRTIRMNSEEFAMSYGCTAEIERDTNFRFRFEDEVIPLERVRSIWHRRWTYPVYPAHFSESEISFCFSELTSLLGGLPRLSQVRWVNNIWSERRASNKLFQLDVCRRLQFRFPRTLVSNDPIEVEDFFRKNAGRVIFKPVSGSSILYRSYSEDVLDQISAKTRSSVDRGLPKTNQVIYTQLLTPEHLTKKETLKWAPAIFQALIEKSADVRVTVIGDVVFACRIHSQERHETSIDFRVMNRGIKLKHETIDLPQQVLKFIKQIMRELDLEFACLDFVVDRESGEYVFLEANPAGQWLWIEANTGAPISAALAKHLATSSPAGPTQA